jgi:hypothetical protein
MPMAECISHMLITPVCTMCKIYFRLFIVYKTILLSKIHQYVHLVTNYNFLYMYSIHILLNILYFYLDDHTFIREGCIISQCSVKTWTF